MKKCLKKFFGPITGHFLAKTPDFGQFWKNLKNGTTFTKMFLRSPNMAKNQLWDISKLFYGRNFLFRSKFRFYSRKKPIFVKKWHFWPFFGSFSAPRMSKNQIKQNSSYKNLTNNIYKLFVRGILNFLSCVHFFTVNCQQMLKNDNFLYPLFLWLG